MLLNSYKTIKKHGLIKICKVKYCSIKKNIFSISSYIFKKRLDKKNQNINIYKNKNFIPDYEFNINLCKKSATQSAQNCFNIFGKITCFTNKINWHIDFLRNRIVPARKKHLMFWKSSFYQNIKITTINTGSINKIHSEITYRDIKVPWELSRLQHIPAVSIAGDTKTFKNHINSWIDNNPFLIGVNWVCPMDVAIRAINLIYGFYLLKNLEEHTSVETFNVIDNFFWIKLIDSLYDHAIYLENNFEIFYKPNNHYIADLLGYFYLCFLFDHIKHFQKAKIKTYKKILEQFDLQIQNDGTSYEGSTSYHKLVTEMFSHFYYLCKKNNIDLPKNFVIKLNKAKQFIKDCTDNAGNFVQIGDNDSGKILSEETFNVEEAFSVLDKSEKTFNVYDNNKIKHYSDFGISIIKNDLWHITYRHPTFNTKQPTGHFHQDELSITFSYNGIPILVDPGSYLYTANKAWRNRMRSYHSHNNFYIEQSEEHASVETFNVNDLSKQDLFSLNKNEQSDTSKITTKENKITIQNFYMPYQDMQYQDMQYRYSKQKSIKAFRELSFDNKITIIDWWQSEEHTSVETFNVGDSEKTRNRKNTRVWKHLMFWNFTFHPEIKLKKIGIGEFEIFHKSKKTFNVNKKIFHLKSDLNFSLFEPNSSIQKNVSKEIGHYSPEYGKIKECTRLFVQASLVQTSLVQKSIDHKKYVTILYPTKTQ